MIQFFQVYFTNQTFAIFIPVELCSFSENASFLLKEKKTLEMSPPFQDAIKAIVHVSTMLNIDVGPSNIDVNL